MGTPSIRLAEILGGLSLATDLAVGLPMETSLGAAILAARMGRALGLPDEARSDLYYATLLRFLGCTISAPEAARDLAAGDEISLNRALAVADFSSPTKVAAVLGELVAPGASKARRRAAVHRTLHEPERVVALSTNHCLLAMTLARALPVRPIVVEALGQTYERWDGAGFPAGLAAGAILLPARALRFCCTVEGWRRMLGPAGAAEALQSRSGELDPELTRLYLRDARRLSSGLDAPSLWDAFLDEEPGARPLLTAGALSEIAEVCAKYVDHKSPFTLGHSTGVAELAAHAGRALGLAREEREHVRVGALLHDLGRCGVPNGLWDKPARFTRMERQRAEMHSYLTETILAACPALQPFGSLAGAARERADGSGYHRRLGVVPAGAALLAAADVYHALTEERPWRRALGPKDAAHMLTDEAKQGRLARDAVHAVLETAGHQQKATRAAWPAGLSNREAEVLCWVARGLSNKDIAARLRLSAKTVEHHVEHVYEKTGVRSRAAAAIFAVERGLFRK